MCGEEVLLVHEDYDGTYNQVYKRNPTVGGMVVTGQPGIGMHLLVASTSLTTATQAALLNLGKTCFLYHLLLHLLNWKQPVTFQVYTGFFLFNGNGAML